MNDVPETVRSTFLDLLRQSRVPPSRHAEYLQWLRYYLHFCEKYSPLPSKSDRVRQFCEKLAEKNQTPEQQQRAAHAVSLYFALLKQQTPPPSPPKADVPASCGTPLHESPTQAEVAVPKNLQAEQSMPRSSNYVEAGYNVTSDSPEWDAVMERLAAEIKVRHYSRKTLKAYATWSRHFQHFLKNKNPDELSSDDAKNTFTKPKYRKLSTTPYVGRGYPNA